MKRFTSLLAIVAVLALSVLSCRTISGIPDSSQFDIPITPQVATVVVVPTKIPAESNSPGLDLITPQELLVNLYETANPGVVSIRVITSDGGAQGSGFVIDDQGHIVTNYHVVENQTDLEIGFSSGLKVRGEVIGTDLDSDLALVKVNLPAEELKPLPLGNSDQVRVGQAVVAIGNPFSLAGTMTTGIVSGLGRTIESLHSTPDGGTFSTANVIQTDAAINPGNSGGPLLNLNGEVIGVNESIRTNTFTTGGQPVNSGVGFAIPINIVKRVAPALIADGKYDYPYLGITSTTDLTLVLQETLELPLSTGVYITGVIAGGPAERAGLQAGTRQTGIPNLRAGGDLIIAIDGEKVQNYNDLIGYLVENKSPGDQVVLTVLRGDQELQLELVLDKRP